MIDEAHFLADLGLRAAARQDRFTVVRASGGIAALDPRRSVRRVVGAIFLHRRGELDSPVLERVGHQGWRHTVVVVEESDRRVVDRPLFDIFVSAP